MLREVAKAGLAAGLHWTGLDRVLGARRGLRQQPLVLGYHRVVADFRAALPNSIAPMLVSSGTLERHLDWLGRRYDFASVDELADVLEGKRTSRRPLAVVTFDDGYADNYHHAFPLLKRKGIPAAVFVVTDLLGGTRLQAHDELYLLLCGALAETGSSGRNHLCAFLRRFGLPPPLCARLCRITQQESDKFKVTKAYLENLPLERIMALLGYLRNWVYIPEDRLQEFHSLDWRMLREMQGKGITIGSHTRSHALLANEPWEKVVEEVKGSRRVLEEGLGVAVRHFAYPDGRFDAKAIRALGEAGFRCAFTTCNHVDAGQPLLTIPRKLLWEYSSMNGFGRFSPAIMSCQVNGIFDPAARCRQQHWRSLEV